LKYELEPLPEQLKRWHSTSLGASYFLEWQDVLLADHDTGTLEILAMRLKYNLTDLGSPQRLHRSLEIQSQHLSDTAPGRHTT